MLAKKLAGQKEDKLGNEKGQGLAQKLGLMKRKLLGHLLVDMMGMSWDKQLEQMLA
jgi:hypothetical protein